MTADRRAFLQWAGSASLLGAAPQVQAAQAHGGEWRLGDYRAVLGQRFAVANGGPALVLRVAEPLGALPNTTAQRSFRLEFEVQGAAGLPQGTWALDHPGGEPQWVFLSPNDAQGRIVEAVFNRV